MSEYGDRFTVKDADQETTEEQPVRLSHAQE